jgi:hypothetical protein
LRISIVKGDAAGLLSWFRFLFIIVSRRLAGLMVFQGIPPGSDFVGRIIVSRVAGLVVFWSCRIGGFLVLLD